MNGRGRAHAQLRALDAENASLHVPNVTSWQCAQIIAAQHSVSPQADLLSLPTQSLVASPLCAAIWHKSLELLTQARIAEFLLARATDGVASGNRPRDPGGGTERQSASLSASPAVQKAVALGGRCPVRHFLEVSGPVWDNVIAFCGTPSDIYGAFMMCRFEDICGEWFQNHPQWEVIFRSRWPAMHSAHKHAHERAWKRTFTETSTGMRSCLLEVLDRELKPGFAMSAHPAICYWDQGRNSYAAKYLSVSDVPEEYIPLKEGLRRLRFCPATARAGMTCPYSGGIDPFRVLPMGELTFDELQTTFPQGQGIELQWKMRAGGPFGWWYAEVEGVEARGNGFHAMLLFRHFPASSPWYRLLVPLCLTNPEPCAIGGFCGGLRRCTAEEQATWQKCLDVHRCPSPQ